MNPKLVKLVVKGAIGLGTSVLIGTVIKTESKLGDVIEDYYKNKKS